MALTNWLMQRTMRKEANRLAKEIAKICSKADHGKSNKYYAEFIKSHVFDEEKLAIIAESSRKRIDVCCETVQGFCYMQALDVGMLKRLMNFRSLQFTYYMDKALEAQGFPPQTKKQKEHILDEMGLKISGWEKWSHD